MHEYTRSGSIYNTYEYDSKGRLSKTIRYVLYDEEGNYDRYFAEYTYFTETTAEYDIEYLD